MIIFLSIVGISRGTAAINSYGLGLGLVEVILSVGLWIRDAIREYNYIGNHTHKVKIGLKLGFLLFIASEVGKALISLLT